MAIRLNPYLSFGDTARQAMEFYHGVFGGELSMSTYGEFGAGDSTESEKIMHAVLETEHGLTLMAADTPAGMEYTPGNTMSISLSGDDADTLLVYWKKLSERGSVTMPLQKQAWGDEFGMCQDRFGIRWMVNISAAR